METGRRDFGQVQGSGCRRIAAARELLRHTDASVKEIAFQFGYCHQFHFANEFTRLAGMSPARFRRSARHELP